MGRPVTVGNALISLVAVFTSTSPYLVDLNATHVDSAVEDIRATFTIRRDEAVS